MSHRIRVLVSALIVVLGAACPAYAKSLKEEIKEFVAQLAAESVIKGEISKLESNKLDWLANFVTSCNLSSISNPLSFVLCVDFIINSGNDPVADARNIKEMERAYEALQRHNVYIEKFCPIFLSKGLPEWQRIGEKALRDYEEQLKDDSLAKAIADQDEKEEALAKAIEAFQEEFEGLRRKEKEYDRDVKQNKGSLTAEMKIIEEARERFEREQRSLVGPWSRQTPHEFQLEWYRQRVPNYFSQAQVDQFLQEYRRTGSYPEAYPPGIDRTLWKWHYDTINRLEATVRASRIELESSEKKLRSVMEARQENLRREKRRIEVAGDNLQKRQEKILELKTRIGEDAEKNRDLAEQALRRQSKLREAFKEILAYEELFRTCIWNMERLSKDAQLRAECPMWRARVDGIGRKLREKFDTIRKP